MVGAPWPQATLTEVDSVRRYSCPQGRGRGLMEPLNPVMGRARPEGQNW